MVSRFTLHSRKAQNWVIDRIEEGWAVLECSGTLESINVLVSNLPPGIKPGVTVVKLKNGWIINEADTADRAARIHKRFNRIKSRN